MSSLRLLREKLESQGTLCLDNLPKNHTFYFKLFFLIVKKEEAHFVGDALDFSNKTLPLEIKSAKEAHLKIRETDGSHLISVYVK